MAPQVVLVTGASGYLASYIIKQLLEEGAYQVRGTVRSLTNEDKVKPIKELVPDAKLPLELVEADLLVEEGWAEAVKGATYVIHVASPFPDMIPANADDLIKPAVEGTLTVLKAASAAGTVKRVVLTSSIAAVYDASIPIPKENEESKKFNEENWTNAEDPHLDTYSRSKTLAEKAAWDFIKELPEDKKMELVVINPGMILGPLISNAMTTSHGVVKKLLDRSVPAIAKMSVNFCDVRDVAMAHIKALTLAEAAGCRHLIVSASMWLKDIALILKKEFQPKGYSVPTMVAPNVFVWLSSLYDKSTKIVVPRLGREFSYSNERMTNVLGITPIETEKTLFDTANSLIEHELIKKKEKKAKKSKADKAETNGTAVEGGDEVKTEVNGKTEEVVKELEPEDKDKPLAVDPAPAVPVAAN